MKDIYLSEFKMQTTEHKKYLFPKFDPLLDFLQADKA